MSGPAHVCVVGGGIVGTSVAYQLARRGVRVTLLERHSRVRMETSRCVSHARDGAVATLTVFCDNGPQSLN